MARDTVLINNNYPLDYAALTGLAQPLTPPNQFWASAEQLAPAADWLILDLGTTRPINFVSFEICMKPFDLTFEYKNSLGNWVPIVSDPDFPATLSTVFIPSQNNPFQIFEYHFTLVQTQFVRITFTRRTDPFPLKTSAPFEYSVEIRNARLIHLINSTTDYVADSGVDILGNAYRTTLKGYDSINVVDDDTTTFWQSQPNPVRDAVEALYFDLRQGFVDGTMGFLDQQRISDLDGRTQENIESFFQNGVVIDEIYIDPITFGPDMNIYYSTDEDSDWEGKLWIPVPRRYVLKKGYHSLPQPTLTKFVKLEFTNLSAVPYNPINYPNSPPITFRRFPTWVQNYFETTQPMVPTLALATAKVDIDPLTFGFQNYTDNLDSGYSHYRDITINVPDPDTQIQNFILTLQRETESSQSASPVESQIQFRSIIMWQEDLINQLDNSRALSRKAKEPRDDQLDTGWNAELTLPLNAPVTVQSTPDLSVSLTDKKRPSMFFPRLCRHAYQLVKGGYAEKIAYYVSIREVSFHRRDYTIEFDEPLYVETLDDESHIEVNDFVQNDWRYEVAP